MNDELCTFTYAVDAFMAAYGVTLKESGRSFFERLEKEYGVGEVLNAIDIVVEQYPDEITAVHKIEGVLYNRKLTRIMMFEENVK